MKVIKKLAVLIAPLLIFVVLLIPYSWVNQQFIVKWFGCSCPVIDQYGNMVENKFNANDFTALFWSFISICVTTISVLLSKRIPKEKIWLRVLYIIGMFLISMLIACQYSQMMMWRWQIPYFIHTKSYASIHPCGIQHTESLLMVAAIGRLSWFTTTANLRVAFGRFISLWCQSSPTIAKAYKLLICPWFCIIFE